MKRLCCVGMIAGLLAVCASAQQSGANQQDAELADRTPAENVRSGAVSQRAPGNVVNAARIRHEALKAARSAAQRTGDNSELAPEQLAALQGGTNPLSNLINTVLNSGLLGGLGNLTGVGGSTGAGGLNIPSNIPPEAIAMIQSAGINIADLFAKPIQSDDAASESAASEAGTQSATPAQSLKIDARSQQVTPTQPKFRVRWADAMLSTLFAAMVVGFQTPDFIDLLADLIRPVIVPPNPTSDDAAKPLQQVNDAEDGEAAVVLLRAPPRLAA